MPELDDPISIEALENDEVLILDNAPGGPSIVHHFLGALSLAAFVLEDDIEVVTLNEATEREHLAVTAHDMVYVAHDQILYAVERDGNQAMAFRLDLDRLTAPIPAGDDLSTHAKPRRAGAGG